MFYQSANLIITSTVMGCLAIAAVAGRLWTKRQRKLAIALDDYLIIFGLVRKLFVLELG
jgi:hypothetical protein